MEALQPHIPTLETKVVSVLQMFTQDNLKDDVQITADSDHQSGGTFVPQLSPSAAISKHQLESVAIIPLQKEEDHRQAALAAFDPTEAQFEEKSTYSKPLPLRTTSGFTTDTAASIDSIAQEHVEFYDDCLEDRGLLYSASAPLLQHDQELGLLNPTTLHAARRHRSVSASTSLLAGVNNISFRLITQFRLHPRESLFIMIFILMVWVMPLVLLLMLITPITTSAYAILLALICSLCFSATTWQFGVQLYRAYQFGTQSPPPILL